MAHSVNKKILALSDTLESRDLGNPHWLSNHVNGLRDYSFLLSIYK